MCPFNLNPENDQRSAIIDSGRDGPAVGSGAEVDALKRLHAGTAAEVAALLPALLDRAFKGEL